MTAPDRPDPGRQAERTALAHVRTWLCVLVDAMLLARQGGPGERWTLAAGGVAVVAVGAVTARRVRGLAGGSVAEARSTLAVVVVAVAVMQVAALVSVA